MAASGAQLEPITSMIGRRGLPFMMLATGEGLSSESPSHLQAPLGFE